MAPLTPTWTRPSHPDVQEVIINEAEFTSKSLSRVVVPPFGLFAKMAFPPCTRAVDGATYATVQFGRDKHLNLNSDLLYINHSCEPSLIFDTANFNILAGPEGLQPGDELTFFYPSTEWHMAQPFNCLCGKPSCRGRISGAKDMKDQDLQGLWINGHIREMLDEKRQGKETNRTTGLSTHDSTAQALRNALEHAEKVVEAAKLALVSYVQTLEGTRVKSNGSGEAHNCAHQDTVHHGLQAMSIGPAAGFGRRGVTSREMSGEMGGDTIHV